MPVTVRIPTPLQRLTNGQGEVACEGKTVTELVADLESRYPGIKERICDQDGRLRRFVNVFVNEEDIRFLQGDQTAVKDGDEVSIIPAIAGGTLSKEQIARYSRQLILPEVGVKGQERLARASVLIVGAGGLGSPAALYLAAAGVGTIGIIDRESVALSNLHRQIAHATDDVGRPKSLSAKARINALNPEVSVVPLQGSLTAANARQVLAPYALVLDGSDNVSTRYLVNDACVLMGRPLVYGGAIHLGGQVMTILPKHSACLRCVFPEPPQPGAIPSCQEAGILGSAAGVIGSVMAHEAIKVLVGIGEPLVNRLLVFDGRAGRFRDVPVRRSPSCAICGEAPTIRELIAVEEPACQEEGAWPRSR
jgi:adenylyltransferase/sulfurtransferase